MEWQGWEVPRTYKKYSKMGRTEITKLMVRDPPIKAIELVKKIQEIMDS